MEPMAREKQISIEINFPEDMLYVYGDRDKFKQMMINLMDNGIKYTNSGGNLWVSAIKDDKNIIIAVEDNGIGVPEDDIPRLFERFYRVDKGRSRKMGGTGLGLAIVKHVVMIFNGDISVSSAFGKGTRFTINLPSAD
jgi:two-component system phosphate regulon sensor histidine kinase PhoR